ncbi:FAD-dependent oxidoreductase [Mesorhizobium wenxiniae]|nr:FAD-dependent oxidoreductase [Mesorhizobium wenxiniae]
MRKLGTVEALWRYPVSSVCGERLQRAEFTEAGPVGDRLYGIFDAETHEIVFPSRQKRWNLAPLISARLDHDDQLQMSLDEENWHNPDDDRFQQKLGELFGCPVTVVRYGADLLDGQSAKPRYQHSPIHLLSRQSIEALKRLLPESVIDERRFRPNVLVDFEGSGATSPEYGLLGKEFRIGNLRLRGTRECGRCSFTTLAQLGLPEDRSVLRALNSNFEKNFGIYCDVLDEGTMESGDEVSIAIPAEQEKTVLIVGAGQAGGMVAKHLRDLGHVGPISIFGDERHTPYERPPLSKPAKTLGPDFALTKVLSGAEAVDLGVDIHLEETVVSIDRASQTIETATGAKHAFDCLVLATGGLPRRLPRVNRGFNRVHAVRTADDAMILQAALRSARRIFVLGGGWLGLEIAAMARSASIEVDLFARDARLCSKTLPSAVGDFLAEVHRANGVKLHLLSEPAFVETPDGVEVSLDGRKAHADLLVLAIGIHPNDHLARLSGLDTRDGILTDENGLTSDPAIFAIGDVSRQRSGTFPEGIRVESWQNANEQAQRAARAILALEQLPTAIPRFWSDQYDLSLQIAGMPDASAVPLAVDGSHNPLWTFENFVIGVNRSRDVHRFAQALAGDSSVGVAIPHKAPEHEGETVPQLLGNDIQMADGDIRRVSSAGLGDLALVRKGDRYFAVEDRCPHAEASLSEGFLEGDRIVCPLHFAEFNLVSGAASSAPKGCPSARTFRVEARGNSLFLHVPTDLPARGGI